MIEETDKIALEFVFLRNWKSVKILKKLLEAKVFWDKFIVCSFFFSEVKLALFGLYEM